MYNIYLKFMYNFRLNDKANFLDKRKNIVYNLFRIRVQNGGEERLAHVNTL
jgi:hypothetical protein